jgi:hypothetical protein
MGAQAHGRDSASAQQMPQAFVASVLRGISEYLTSAEHLGIELDSDHDYN